MIMHRSYKQLNKELKKMKEEGVPRPIFLFLCEVE